MSATNRGNQVLAFDYKHPAKGANFNYLLRGIVKPGIYKGATLSKVDATTIRISPFIAFFDVDTDKAIHISTSTNVDLTADSTTPILYMTFSWLDVDNDWIDFGFRAVGTSPVTNEVTLGTIGFTGTVVNGTFDITERTYGTTDDSYNMYCANKLYFGSQLDTELYRYSAGLLYTPDIFQAVGGLVSGGANTFTNVTDSSSISTGALVVSGGVGVAKNVNAGGDIKTTSTTEATSKTTGSIIAGGGAGFSGRVVVGHSLRLPEWETSVLYKVGDIIQRTTTGGSPTIYFCVVQHTSGTFGTDWITNTYWSALTDAPGDEKLLLTETIPYGWLEEKGNSLVRTDYADLYARIGTYYGAADASHFNIPSPGGYFFRIKDNASAVDPDAASFSIINVTTSNGNPNITFSSVDLSKKRLIGATITGSANIPVNTRIKSITGTPFAVTGFVLTENCTGNSSSVTATIYGDKVGTRQPSAMQGHQHTYSHLIVTGGYGAANGITWTGVNANSTSPVTDGTNGTPYTTSETRAVNEYRVAIIKF